MNLRRFKEYLAVLENGSIGAAADSLGMSQPGLSKSIRRLEEELGVPLLERLPRGVRPTIYGEVFRDCAATVSFEAEKAFSEIGSIRDGTSGTVRAGAGADWLISVVPKAIAALHRKSPRVSVRFFGGFNDDLHGMLLAREIDFCLATLPVPEFDPLVQYEHWVSDRFLVVARREHPIHGRGDLTLEDLLSYQWALPVASPVLLRSLEKLFREYELSPPKPSLETNYMSLCLTALVTYDYLGWVTDLQLKRGNHPDLVPVNLPEARVARKAGLLTRRGETLNTASRVFVAELKAICEQEFGLSPENKANSAAR